MSSSSLAATLPVLHFDDVAGLRTVWVDAGRSTMSAVLTFRVGMQDELLPARGMTHLIEHLVLHDLLSPGALSINGSVSGVETRFLFHGPPQQVTDALTHVITFLNDPDFSLAQKEARVLSVEGRKQGGSLTDAVLWRFGLQGPGVVSSSEYFLDNFDGPALAAHLRRYFNASNAVLALDGPPELALPLLHAGEPAPCPAATPTLAACPSWFPLPDFLLSGVAPRTISSTFAPEILRWRLLEKLRKEHALAYSPSCAYIPISADEALLSCLCEAKADEPLAATVGLAVLDDLAANGPTLAEVNAQGEYRKQTYLDPNCAFSFALSAADDVLLDRKIISPEEYVQQCSNIGLSDIHQAFQAWRASLMLGFPGSSTPIETIPRDTAPVFDVTGHEFHHAPGTEIKQAIVGDFGMKVTIDGCAQSVLWSDVLTLLQTEDGAMRITDRGGWPITIEPTMWTDGFTLVHLIAARLPVYTVRETITRPAESIPRPPTRFQLLKQRLKRN